MFWPVKISLLVWHFLSCPNPPNPFLHLSICAAVKGDIYKPSVPGYTLPKSCQGQKWRECVIKLQFRFLSVEPTIAGVSLTGFLFSVTSWSLAWYLALGWCIFDILWSVMQESGRFKQHSAAVWIHIAVVWYHSRTIGVCAAWFVYMYVLAGIWVSLWWLSFLGE